MKKKNTTTKAAKAEPNMKALLWLAKTLKGREIIMNKLAAQCVANLLIPNRSKNK